MPLKKIIHNNKTNSGHNNKEAFLKIKDKKECAHILELKGVVSKVKIVLIYILKKWVKSKDFLNNNNNKDQDHIARQDNNNKKGFQEANFALFF